jgi:3-deoxy-manno-octulosonate cytidylyltransferase (CMP-KDO synthetase)
MIVQVVRRAEESGIKDVFVAAGDKEIAEIVMEHGHRAVMTYKDHPSGTDRIREALVKVKDNEYYDTIINVQGDLPTLDPKIIQDIVLAMDTDDYDIVTAVAKISEESEKTNPNVVKAVVSWKSSNFGSALYFTRATAPHGEGDLYHHIGLYCYKRAALEKFVSLPPSPLEKRERLEQLRALENNMKIGVVLVETIPLGVDTHEDLERARKILGA